MLSWSHPRLRARPAKSETWAPHRTRAAPRLLLLDGHSLAYRAFFALPAENFRTQTGQTTNAVYGFTSMLINLLRDEQPTHLAVAFDLSRQTFRREVLRGVQERAAVPRRTSSAGRSTLIQDILGALSIPWLTKDNYEADDVIATLTTQATAEGYDVLVCTGDRDCAAVGHRPGHGAATPARVCPISPGLRRPRSRSSTACPRRSTRIWPRCAATRRTTCPAAPASARRPTPSGSVIFGSLGDLIDPGGRGAARLKAGDALRAYLSAVQLNGASSPRWCGTWRSAWNRPSWRCMGLGPDALHKLFDDLQFRVLRDRLFATLSSAEPEADEGFEVRGGPIMPGRAGRLAGHARRSRPRRVGLALQGYGQAAAHRCNVRRHGAGRGRRRRRGRRGDADRIRSEQALAHWPFADHDRVQGGPRHEGDSAARAARRAGWRLGGLTSDTRWPRRTWPGPGQRTFELDATWCCATCTASCARTSRTTASSRCCPARRRTNRNALPRPRCSGPRVVAELADALDAELVKLGGVELQGKLELPLLHVLAELGAGRHRDGHRAAPPLRWRASFAGRAASRVAQDRATP